jgi:SAM-dependent methyltransferase
MLDLAAQRHAHKALKEFDCTLEFGCGSGRILRYVADGKSAIHACEVNETVAEFTKQSFPTVEVYHSPLMPPLHYEDGKFDLVYSFSVFSHLPLDVENTWLSELIRVGAPGCLFLLSIHGDWVIEATLGEKAGAAVAAGFSYREGNVRNGGVLDFPEYYETSYHTSQYVRHVWGQHFEILDIIKGDDPSLYLWQDLQFELGGAAPSFRAMGQDLVVARKRS